MGTINIDGASRPTRTRREGLINYNPKGSAFRHRMPPAAQRYVFIRQAVLFKNREAPVNPNRTEIDDPAEASGGLKRLAHEMGADIVGIAAYDPRFAFTDSEILQHRCVIVFGMSMKYDAMAEIGPKSQEEVHRVYYSLDDIAVRLTHHIGSFGYSARTQHNAGDFPLPAYGYLAGLGELGKHGSLISPVLGSSFRLSAVSTDMPLEADGPQDHGIDEICASCNMCARFCPGEAIGNEKVEINGITRWHVDTPACQPWFLKMYGCKICLMVCPINSRGLVKESYKDVAKDIRAARDAEGLLSLLAERSGEDFRAMDVPSDIPETEPDC